MAVHPSIEPHLAVNGRGFCYAVLTGGGRSRRVVNTAVRVANLGITVVVASRSSSAAARVPCSRPNGSRLMEASSGSGLGVVVVLAVLPDAMRDDQRIENLARNSSKSRSNPHALGAPMNMMVTRRNTASATPAAKREW